MDATAWPMPMGARNREHPAIGVVVPTRRTEAAASAWPHSARALLRELSVWLRFAWKNAQLHACKGRRERGESGDESGESGGAMRGVRARATRSVFVRAA
jgi:hypothetical protein